MSRSGYTDNDYEGAVLYRGRVARAMKGRRGQKFLRELAQALDGMEFKELIADDLIDDEGNCCAIGVVCKTRGVDVCAVDPEDPEAVGKLVNIATSMAREISYENDEGNCYIETPQHRWTRMRGWVTRNIKK